MRFFFDIIHVVYYIDSPLNDNLSPHIVIKPKKRILSTINSNEKILNFHLRVCERERER